MKKKMFVFINILGMGMAVALCIIAYLNWSFRNEWDSAQQNGQNIYRIQFWHDFHGQRDRYGISPMPLADHIRENFKDVKAVTRFLPESCNMRIGDELFNTSIAYGDSAFVEMFTFDILHGKISDFKEPSNIFISAELARKYFGREDVVGEQITQMNFDNRQKEFTIGGVFRKWPINASFRFEAITLWDNYWARRPHLLLKDTDWAQMTTTLVQMDDPSKVEEVAIQLQQYVEPQNNARPDLKVQTYYLDNFMEIHNTARLHPVLKANDLRPAQPDAVVTIPSIMAGMLLLLACFNFTNTSIAISSQRLKEIGIRKVMGGVRKQLITQFMGENLFLCFLGFVAGLLIAEWLVPAYDSLFPWLELNFNYADQAGILLFLLGLLFFTALVAGGYPAFYVTSFEPVNILKGTSKLGGTSWLTRILLGVQFCFSLIIIIFAVGFYNNAKYQKNYDLGFSTTGVISVWASGEKFDTYRHALEGNDDILKIAGTKHHVTNWFYPGTVRYESTEKEIDIMDVGDDYLEAMNIRLISGRSFKKDSETDRVESVVVTEELVRQFGWKDDAVGKRIVWKDTVHLYVIGVARDIYARSVWQPLEPMMIRYIPPKNYAQIVVQVPGEKVIAVDAFMKEKWKEVFPNEFYDSQLAAEYTLDRTNETNNSGIIIFTFLGFFAALMSATGLFTLVSLTILKRLKEIGIRKVLGASVVNLVGVISFEFMVILICASLLGGLIGYKMVDMTMDAAWEYYQRVSLSTLATSVAIIILLAILTVGLKTVRAARMNPVKNLRTE